MLARLSRLRFAHLRALSVALLATAFSAGLAFADGPGPAADAGLENAAVHAGKTLPVQAGDQDETNDQDEDSEESEEAGDNCATDPTGLDEEELAALRHGSIVCWAAHQDTWPEEFDNHGQWVSSWAKSKSQGGHDTSESLVPGNGKAKGLANRP